MDPMSFLVVDDDPSMTAALGRLLRSDGYRTSSFTSGAAAVAAIETETFGVVLTDLEMPSTDGRAVLRAAGERLSTSCLVVHTGTAREERGALCREGACFVVDKPLDYELLRNILTACRARARKPAEPCPMRAELSLLKLRVP